ncbi:hypothetical protein [Acidiferrobacter sp.]|jgi:hypothetical protein|uniref:hypothetical protein n=1 Tax=Acidiferrobacter sp. TaxID=1872107 RepID=UPI002319DCDE|nr:hypothetical protein [Acidiferrobacter sp.]MDA8191414.1 hypothetical protein [Gammaproteobacteria bacterium]
MKQRSALRREGVARALRSNTENQIGKIGGCHRTGIIGYPYGGVVGGHQYEVCDNVCGKVGGQEVGDLTETKRMEGAVGLVGGKT